MKSVFGNNLVVSLFGESHSKYIGITLNGLPSGEKIDYDFIDSELSRRRPHKNNETKRIENDDYEIISGIFNSYTTGAPLTILIKNNDIDSSSYVEGVVRPGTSDYPNYVRSDGFNDYRGSGHSSGRLTAALVAGGAIVKKLLEAKDIKIAAITKSEDIKDNDTYGFTAIIKVSGLPIGVGEPFFDSVEAVLSHLLFSIPSVKGVSFGDIDIATKKGSEVVDELRYEDGKIVIKANHNGGINGGLTNGNDLVINVSFKPISTLAIPVKTVNLKTKENVELNACGRHDKSIAGRAPVILENMVAIILKHYFHSKKLINQISFWWRILVSSLRVRSYFC